MKTLCCGWRMPAAILLEGNGQGMPDSVKITVVCPQCDKRFVAECAMKDAAIPYHEAAGAVLQ